MEIQCISTLVVFIYFSHLAYGVEFYPFGVNAGDKRCSKQTFVHNEEKVDLNVSILGFWNIYIQDQGVVGFQKNNTRLDARIPSTLNFILPYTTNFGTKGEDSFIYYRQTDDVAILRKIDQDIERLRETSTKQITNALIVTFVNLRNNYSAFRKNTFQLVIGYDAVNRAYGIFNYQRLDDTGALAGFSLGHCKYESFAIPKKSHLLITTSNVGTPGRHVYNLNNNNDCKGQVDFAIPLSEVTYLPKGDGVEQQITLSKPIPLFQGNYSKFYLSIKGRLLLQMLGNVKAPDIEFMNIDAILFAEGNFDTSKGGSAYYKEEYNTKILQKASKYIERVKGEAFTAVQMLVIVYKDLYLSESENSFSYEVALTSDGQETYAIIRYLNHINSVNLKTGYSCKNCEWNWLLQLNAFAIDSSTNTGYAGQMILKVTSEKCFSDVMLPHNVFSHSTKLPRKNEHAEVYNFLVQNTIYGQPVTKIGVAVNGVLNINFTNKNIGKFVSKDRLVTNDIIAPLYNNFTIDKGGAVYLLDIKTSKFLTKLTNIVREETNHTNFTCSSAFIVTFIGLQQNTVIGSRNTFQVALAFSGDVTYAVMSYYEVDSTHFGYAGVSTGACHVDFPLDDLMRMQRVVYPMTKGECTAYNERTTTTSTPTETTTATNGIADNSATSKNSDSSTSTGVVIGASVGGAVVFVLLSAVVTVLIKRAKKFSHKISA